MNTEEFVNPILILDAIAERINSLDLKSWDKSNVPTEQRNTVRHRAEHWIAFEGSKKAEETEDTLDPWMNKKTSILRIMEFSTFVRVIDLQKNFRDALLLHEEILSALNGFRPDLPFSGVIEPLKFISDNLVAPSARDTENVFKYQGRYSIVTELGTYAENFDPFTLTKLNINVWRSDIDHIGDYDRSTQDTTINIRE